MDEKDSVNDLRHFRDNFNISGENNTVNVTTTEYLVKELNNLKNNVIELRQEINEIKLLKQEINRLELLIASRSSSKIEKLQRIKELCECNELVYVDTICQELKLNSKNYVRELMQEASKKHGLTYFEGVKGQQSFLMKKEPENKIDYAYADCYQQLLEKPIGSTISISAISHKYRLDDKEVQTVFSRMLRHPKFSMYNPREHCGLGERRIKRIR